MGELLNLLKSVLDGHPVTLGGVIVVLCAVAVFPILAKYIEKSYFNRFPYPDQDAIIASLHKELLREIAMREDAQRIAIAAIEQSHAFHAETIRLRRLIMKIDGLLDIDRSSAA